MARGSPFRLPVGALVSTSLGIYFRNLFAFLVLGVAVFSPWIALQVWIAGARLRPEDLFPLLMLGLLLQNVLTMLLTGAITYGVVRQLRGERAPFGASVSKGFGSFFSVLGTGFLCSLRIFAFSMLLIIPGIIELVRLYVAVPVAVMEDKGGGVAVRRSIELVRGSGWSLFGAWLLVAVLGGVFAGVLGFLFKAVDDHVLENPWFNAALTVSLQTYGSTLMATAYFLLRKGKENIDIKAIAKVFE